MWGRIFQTERKGWTKAFKERGPFKALKEGQNAEDGQRGGGGGRCCEPRQSSGCYSQQSPLKGEYGLSRERLSTI